jgi:fatty acid desaturase
VELILLGPNHTTRARCLSKLSVFLWTTVSARQRRPGVSSELKSGSIRKKTPEKKVVARVVEIIAVVVLVVEAAVALVVAEVAPVVLVAVAEVHAETCPSPTNLIL